MKYSFKRILLYWPIIIIVTTVVIFFYKTFFSANIPFPGDILISEYKPWNKYSFSGYAPGSYPNKAQYPDTIRQIYPWKTLVISELKKGNLPLWNPYNFSGAPLLANFQSAALHPDNLLYLVLPQPAAWTILVILQPLLAFLFMYIFMRSLHLNKIGALFGGFTYAFSYFSIVWLEYNTIGHVILWLPLILYTINRLSEKTILWKIIYILSHVCAILSGHPQIYGYLLIITLIYSVYKKVIKTALLLSVLSIGLTSLQLLPGLELITNSARSQYDYVQFIQKILLWPWHLIMLLVPDFFGNPATRNYWLTDTYIGKVTSVGVAPLILVLAGLFGKRIKLKSPAIILCFSVLLLITVNPVSLVLYRIPLPFISSSSPNLMVFLLEFGLAYLAGMVLSDWSSGKLKFDPFRKALFILSIIFLLLWIAVFFLPLFKNIGWTDNLGVSRRPLLLSTVIFAGLSVLFFTADKLTSLKSPFIVLIFIIQIFELNYAFQKFTPFVKADFIFPAVPIITELKRISGFDRYWGYGSAVIDSNFATQYSIFATDGYDPLYPKIYGQLIHSSGNGKIPERFTNSTRSDAYLAYAYGTDNITNNAYRQRLMDVMGIRYILDLAENGSTEKTFPPDRFSEVYSDNTWKILENRQVIPRVYIASKADTFESSEEFEEKFYDPNFNPYSTVLLDKTVPYPLERSGSTPSAYFTLYEPENINIRTSSDSNGMLVLTDTFYPGWVADIDGLRTPIYRANFSFRAVYLPKGSHTVRFRYLPASITNAKYITGLSIIIMVFWFVCTYRKNYKKKM